MDWKNDEVLKNLIEKGKESGSLTYDELNAALPEGASDPDRLQDILELLDTERHQRHRRREDAEDARRRRPPSSRKSSSPTPSAPSYEDSDGDGRHIDDPVRMYLTQMGEIPLLDREQEIAAGQEDRGHPPPVPPQGAGVRLRPAAGGRDAQARPSRRPAVRPHDQGVADGEPRKGQDPRADAAQPADARTADGAERRGLPAAHRRAHAGKDARTSSASGSGSAAARRSRWSRSCRSARRRSSR